VRRRKIVVVGVALVLLVLSGALAARRLTGGYPSTGLPSPLRSTTTVTTTASASSGGASPEASIRAEAPVSPGEFVIAGIVTSVVDGDTVDVVDDSGGGRVRVRVLGIDTPETKDPRKPVQCWGPEASAFAERVLLAQRVSLYADPTQSTRDRYGRLLAYIVLPDGHTNYSVAAAAAGAARSYVYGGHPVSLWATIAAAEQNAQATRLGLWGPPCNGAAVGNSPAADVSPPETTAADPVYFSSCAAARAAGHAPLRRGEPGYRAKLDRDDDGEACE